MSFQWTQRQLPRLVMVAVAFAATSLFAQTWPTKPVRVIVPVGPGSAPDVVARLLSDRLSTAWGQGVVIENKPGAGGIPGMSTLARADKDGYTIGFVPAAMGTITPLVFKNPQFNPDTDLLPVATVGTSPLLLVTPTATGIQNLADLAKAAKASPGKVNFAAPQLNSLPHLAGEVLNKAGGMGLYTIPYPTPPAAINAVLAGDATVTADGVPSLISHVRGGKLKALAVTSAQRLPGLDIPTVAETYPGYEVIGWFQIIVPTGTPAAVNEKINRDVNRIMQQPDMVARLAELGIYPKIDTLSGAKEFFVEQQKAMKKLVTELGIQPQ
jgi:tripartite-type tricarboxylate transporter receptor subunit TctC